MKQCVLKVTSSTYIYNGAFIKYDVANDVKRGICSKKILHKTKFPTNVIKVFFPPKHSFSQEKPHMS